MSGGPPHLDLFDYKPELVKWNDKPCPDEFLKGRRFAFTTGVPKLMGTPHKFAQHGKAGMWMSDALTTLAGRSGRLVPDQVDEYRAVQPHPGGIVAVHRLPALRASVNGLLGHVWFGQ